MAENATKDTNIVKGPTHPSHHSFTKEDSPSNKNPGEEKKGNPGGY